MKAILILVLIIVLAIAILAGWAIVSATATPEQAMATITPSSMVEWYPEYTIRIELHSPTAFEVSDSANVVRIGEKEFTVITGPEDGTPNTLIVFLKPAEFAALANGDPVVFTYGKGSPPVRFFGRLDKSKLVRGRLAINEDLQRLRQYMLDLLTAQQVKVTDKTNKDKVNNAVKHMTQSLNRTLWIDSYHLSPKDGETLFNEDKEVFDNLHDLPAELSTFTHSIVNNERALAAQAIEDAVAARGEQKEIDKAKDELGQGYRDSLQGNLDSAIEHYRNAWDHALKAAKKR